MKPGEYILAAGDIELNAGRRTLRLQVANTGDRPIQVGSHYHFHETNAALRFDRAAARGMRLDILARLAGLVAFGGDRIVHGFRGMVNGALDARRAAGKPAAPKRKAAKRKGA